MFGSFDFGLRNLAEVLAAKTAAYAAWNELVPPQVPRRTLRDVDRLPRRISRIPRLPVHLPDLLLRCRRLKLLEDMRINPRCIANDVSLCVDADRWSIGGGDRSWLRRWRFQQSDVTLDDLAEGIATDDRYL
jgi:hypothetical protein